MRARKKKHGSQRLSIFDVLLCHDPAKIRENPIAPFEYTRPLRLEIGCGKGDFITALSAIDMEYNYYAMELVDDVLVTAAEKYAVSRGLGEMGVHGGWAASDGNLYTEPWDIPMAERGNVRFIRGDAKTLCDYFPDGTFDTIYANFSDPWPKKGYENRRLTSPAFLKEYIRVLAPGGKFVFKTDNDGLFEYSLETVGASELTLTFHTLDLHASERAERNIMTEYERNFSEKGVKIKMLEAVKSNKE
jgi:tRNA (guanine-N7-)-methyltransferase